MHRDLFELQHRAWGKPLAAAENVVDVGFVLRPDFHLRQDRLVRVDAGAGPGHHAVEQADQVILVEDGRCPVAFDVGDAADGLRVFDHHTGVPLEQVYKGPERVAGLVKDIHLAQVAVLKPGRRVARVGHVGRVRAPGDDIDA